MMPLSAMQPSATLEYVLLGAAAVFAVCMGCMLAAFLLRRDPRQ